MNYNVLYSVDSPDNVIERGRILQNDAEKIFLSFPFESEIIKRNKNPELMAPTITFHDEEKNYDLAVWTEDAINYELWFPQEMISITNMPKMDVIKYITHFFSKEYDSIK